MRHSTVSQPSRSCVASAYLCIEECLCLSEWAIQYWKDKGPAPKNLAQWELPDLPSWNLQVKSFLNCPLFGVQRQAPLWPLLVFFTCHISCSPGVMMFHADHSAVRLSMCNSPGNRFSVWFFFNLCNSVCFQKSVHTLHRGPWAIVVLNSHLTSPKLLQWSLLQFYFFFFT